MVVLPTILPASVHPTPDDSANVSDFRHAAPPCVKVLLLDCDGVLADTELLSCSAVADAFTAAGAPVTPHEALRIFTGCDRTFLRGWLAEHGVADAAAALAHKDRLTYKRIGAAFSPDPELIGFLEGLRRDGIRWCVTSNSLHRRLSLTLGRLGVLELTGEAQVFSAEDVARGKPAPDLHLLACRRMGVAPEEALVVDDSVSGIRGARAADIRAVGFVRYAHDREAAAAALRAAGAFAVVTSLEEVGTIARTLPTDGGTRG